MDQRLAMRAVAERVIEGTMGPNVPPADAADGKPGSPGAGTDSTG